MSRLPTDQTICVLQNDNSYWSEDRGWTWDLHSAAEFSSVKEAVEYAAAREFNGAHVLLFRNRGVTRIDPVMLHPIE